MIESRSLLRYELPRVWEIDRSETTERMYRVENGKLVLRPAQFDVRGWPAGEREKDVPLFEQCFDSVACDLGAP